MHEELLMWMRGLLEKLCMKSQQEDLCMRNCAWGWMHEELSLGWGMHKELCLRGCMRNYAGGWMHEELCLGGCMRNYA
jgi:hypothetical protein